MLDLQVRSTFHRAAAADHIVGFADLLGRETKTA
jgi:hypothetical protein